MLKRTDPIDLARAHLDALRRLAQAEDSPALQVHVDALAQTLDASFSRRPAAPPPPADEASALASSASTAPRYLDLFEHHPLGTFVVDGHGQIIIANLAATTLCGARREELVGASLAAMTTGDSASTLLRHVQRVVATGFERGCEVQLRRTDASVIELALEMSPYPPEPAHVIVSAVEVTGRKRIERTLRESAERYRGIFEDARDGLVTLSEGWQLVDANASACRLFGVPLRELTRRVLWSFFPLEVAAQQRDALMREAASANPALVELIVQRRHDERLRLEASVGVGLGPKGRVFELGLRDVSSRPRLEDELDQLLDRLQHAQKLETLGRLSTGVAHDLGNVMTAVNGLATAVLGDLPPDSPLREDLDALLEANQRGSEVTRQLMSFARHESLRQEAIPLGPILRDAVGLTSRGVRHVAFELDVQEGLVVDGDVHALEQIFLNLLLNALDALGGGGTIRVEAAATSSARGEPSVRVRVVDDGDGMDAQTRGRAFEPFFTTKAAGVGTGLGLAVTRRFVTALGGHIELESEPDRGTRVTVELPASVRRPVGLRGADPAALEGLRALVIDDEPLVLAAFRRMLKGLGVQSETAGSGREGIEAFEREPDAYDVVILDMNMHELDGVAVLAHLLERRAEQRVLFTSGDVRERVPDTYRRLGNVGFLRKPFLQKDLLCEVSALLHGPSLFGP